MDQSYEGCGTRGSCGEAVGRPAVLHIAVVLWYGRRALWAGRAGLTVHWLCLRAPCPANACTRPQLSPTAGVVDVGEPRGCASHAERSCPWPLTQPQASSTLASSCACSVGSCWTCRWVDDLARGRMGPGRAGSSGLGGQASLRAGCTASRWTRGRAGGGWLRRGCSSERRRRRRRLGPAGSGAPPAARTRRRAHPSPAPSPRRRPLWSTSRGGRPPRRPPRPPQQQPRPPARRRPPPRRQPPWAKPPRRARRARAEGRRRRRGPSCCRAA